MTAAPLSTPDLWALFEPDGRLSECSGSMHALMGGWPAGWTHAHWCSLTRRVSGIPEDPPEDPSWARVCAGLQVQGYLRRVRPNGQALWLQGGYKLQKNTQGELVAVAFRGQVASSSEVYRTFAERQHSAVGRFLSVLEVDMSGTVTQCNRQFAEDLGFLSDDIVGQPHHALLDSLFVQSPSWLAAVQAMAHGQSASGEWQYTHQNGSPVWFEAMMQPMTDDSGVPFKQVMLGVNRTQAVQQRKQAEAMKSAFLSHAAHELRTPMTTVAGYLELLSQRQYSSEKARMIVDQAYRGAQRVMQIVTDLLDLDRIENAGQMALHMQPTPVQDLMDHVHNSLMLDSYANKWHVAYLPSAEVVRQQPLWADAQALGRALTNVVSNAIKYSPIESPIDIRVRTGEGHTDIEVQDHGVGMSAEELNHLGQKFWRADQSGHVLGTGLGFALAQQIVRQHQGELRVVSAPGQGTTVTLRVPHPPAPGR